MTLFCRSKSRGFTILELMIYVGLIAFISVVTARIFRATVKSWHQTDSRHTAEAGFDSALSRLRQDVWSASAITIPDQHTLVLQMTAGRSVTWLAGNTGTLSRIDPGDGTPLRWEWLGDFTFTSEGPNVLLSEQGRDADEVVLTSQAMLLNGGAP